MIKFKVECLSNLGLSKIAYISVYNALYSCTVMSIGHYQFVDVSHLTSKLITYYKCSVVNTHVASTQHNMWMLM